MNSILTTTGLYLRMNLFLSTPCQFLIILCIFLNFKNGQAQNISHMLISPDESMIAYVIGGDSLFIREIKSSEINETKLIDTGLKENGNQRFLVWVDKGRTLIYEKDSNLMRYSVVNNSSQLIKHNLMDSLHLFRWYMIRQIASHDENLFFAAANKNKRNQSFQLFHLNYRTGICLQLTQNLLNAGNVSISPDGKLIAVAFYNYIKNNPITQLLIIEKESNQKVFESSRFEDVFINSLSWSDNGTFLLTQENETSSRLYSLNITEKSLNEIKQYNGKDGLPLEFLGDSSLLFNYYKDYKNNIGSINFITNEERVFSNDNLKYLQLTKNNETKSIYTFSESRIQPKKLLQLRLAGNEIAQINDVKITNSRNTLEKYSFNIITYQDATRGDKSAFIYTAKNHSRSKKTGLIILPYGGYINSYPDTDYFLYSKLFEYLDKGYIIAFPNTRGINSEKQSNHYGKVQLEDTELFLLKLKSQFNVDTKKIILLGHSHGATMVYYYLTHSTSFSGGISINGACDWIQQAELKSMAGIPFGMGGDPLEKELEYNDSSPLTNLNSLSSPILNIAGRKDTQIPARINAIAFHEAATKLGKKSELIIFENEGHLILLPENRDTFWKALDAFIYTIAHD